MTILAPDAPASGAAPTPAGLVLRAGPVLLRPDVPGDENALAAVGRESVADVYPWLS